MLERRSLYRQTLVYIYALSFILLVVAVYVSFRVGEWVVLNTHTCTPLSTGTVNRAAVPADVE